MPNTITTQVLEEGPRNLVLNVVIVGDGSGDEASSELVNAAGLGVDRFSIERVQGALGEFAVELEWDATANVTATVVPPNESDLNYRQIGAIPNNAGAGVTGNIDISTTNLASQTGSFVLWLKKKED